MERIEKRAVEKGRSQKPISSHDCEHSKYGILEETFSGKKTGKYLCSNCYQYYDDKYYAVVQMECKKPMVLVFKCNKFDLILEKLSQAIERKVGSTVINISLNPKEFKEDWEWSGFHFKATTLVGGEKEEGYNMFISRIDSPIIE
ncbi:hypothetical protein D1013_08930 [Euzebyella marina]|uniref:Uncharacterized protein n=1 Tax=Euzebyella marina TaxID=1761453 RepID=A0A3G2L5D1_9FLAO|nr:hypothetical protein [Euzebyella marina]AYN67475.1 hypothetical protein D1013_08930 [Euzebyella marina]